MIINDILDFSKIESNHLQLEIVPFNLASLISSLSDSYGLRASEKNIELIMDGSGITETMVKGDPGRLRQIINNLLGNALKFTEQGEILIKATLLEQVDEGDKGLSFICSITDSGIGIPTDKQSSMFDVFTQVDASTTRKYGGTGLGLSVTKQLCEIMGGSISVKSELGKGACFEFTVPLGKSSQSVVIQPPASLGECKILVVDDNASNRSVLRHQLGAWGANVVEAKNGVKALALLAEQTFDLAIIDRQMPEMNGVTLGKKIREELKLSHVKLILMTSMTDHGDTQYFSDLGFQAYMPKPVTTDDLLSGLSILSNSILPKNDTSMSQRDISDDAHPKVENRESGVQVLTKSKLLIVDDVVMNRQVVMFLLDGQNFIIDTASNGQEALDKLSKVPEEEPYQLILMDCQMPEMDGYQATEYIRQGKAGVIHQAIPIIAMTANILEEDKKKCFDSGMNDYISKPIDSNLLKEKLSQWLSRVVS